MRYITADYVFPVSVPKVKEGVVVMDGDRVVDITRRDHCDKAQLEYFKGIVLPGFVNAHCHLELSHMAGLAETGTRLIPFIRNVVQLRDFEQEVIDKAIREQDSAMYAAGIQAVGDISNKADTARVKAESPIRYYTFVEMFDFMQDKLLAPTIENYTSIYKAHEQSVKNRKSYVPHAPYSVSPGLFDFINKHNQEDATISIHNQETDDENRLFMDGSGGFKSFFAGFGIDMEAFKPHGTPSINYALAHLQPAARNIFVHNTMCTAGDIDLAHEWSDQVYWATCPNANLFIENKLPDYSLFMERNAVMAIGTDSIMSNWQLSVWEEIKTMKKYQSYIPLEKLIAWGTINGARALGFDDELGSIEKGKSPGLVHVDLEWKGEDTELNNSSPHRIL